MLVAVAVCGTTHALYAQELLSYTEQQQADMMHMRRLFYGKLGQLQRQRADLLSDMGDETKTNHPRQFNIDFKHTAARVAETQEFANKLCANRAEENRAYIYCGVSLFVCVSTL